METPEPKATCSECGCSILQSTATRNAGRCRPCADGRRRPQKKFSLGRAHAPGRSVDWMSIGIIKDKETEDFVDYFFFSDVWDKDPRFANRRMIVGQNRGLLRLEKESGSIELLAPMPEDRDARRFRKAALSLAKHWNKGEFPDATSYCCG